MSTTERRVDWRELEAASRPDPARLRFIETPQTVGGHAVLAGIDASGHRHLCIRTARSELGRRDSESRGITLETKLLLDPDSTPIPFVDVHCRRPDLDSLFETIVEEMLDEMRRRPDEPFEAASAVLKKWREFLAFEGPSGLGVTQLAGLFAELLLLRELAAPGRAPPVEAWVGPEGAPHDFVRGSFDVEVKSTLATTGRRIHVNGIEQLRSLPGTRLLLWWVRLRPSPGRGMGLPQLVAQLLSMGAEERTLMEKLELAGCRKADLELYADRTFEQIESCLYEVDAGFPRIVPESFAEGPPAQLVGLDYVLALDGPFPQALGPAAAEALLGELRC